MLNTMAQAYLSLGSFQRAAELFRQSLALLRQTHDINSVEVAEGTIWLARALGRAGSLPESERLCREAVAHLPPSGAWDGFGTRNASHARPWQST